MNTQPKSNIRHQTVNLFPANFMRVVAVGGVCAVLRVFCSWTFVHWRSDLLRPSHHQHRDSSVALGALPEDTHKAKANTVSGN
eukprot:5546260-Amphidinium_carterae.1